MYGIYPSNQQVKPPPLMLKKKGHLSFEPLPTKAGATLEVGQEDVVASMRRAFFCPRPENYFVLLPWKSRRHSPTVLGWYNPGSNDPTFFSSSSFEDIVVV